MNTDKFKKSPTQRKFKKGIYKSKKEVAKIKGHWGF